MEGRIHSIESMGLVDGPGIRVVVFLQGCKLRCLYCHNPDTWMISGGEMVEPEDLMKKIRRYRPYFEKSGGGVTFSGGEPLMQPEFLLECLKICRREGIHTVLDTAGYGFGDYREILENTDLVIFDMKHIDPKNYLMLTGQTGETASRFLDAVQEAGVKMWVRHVVVPGMTDGEKHIRKLAATLKPLKGVIKVELLPYHTLGQNKYEELNIRYKLEGVEAMDKGACARLFDVLFEELGEDYYLESNR